ncbi:MAG: hypothetical protein WA364_23490 [Candidatus Nitrosopolaris sp.]
MSLIVVVAAGLLMFPLTNAAGESHHLAGIGFIAGSFFRFRFAARISSHNHINTL